MFIILQNIGGKEFDFEWVESEFDIKYLHSPLYVEVRQTLMARGSTYSNIITILDKLTKV